MDLLKETFVEKPGVFFFLFFFGSMKNSCREKDFLRWAAPLETPCLFSFLLLLLQRTGIMEMREAMQEKVSILVCYLLKLWPKTLQFKLVISR